MYIETTQTSEQKETIVLFSLQGGLVHPIENISVVLLLITFVQMLVLSH